MASYPKLSNEILANLCAVVGDTSEGLTGSQIGKYLAASGIKDPLPGITKRDRLLEALRAKQDDDDCSNNIFAFLMIVMNPVNYTQNHDYFEARRYAINQALLFAGYELTPEGKIKLVDCVQNLTESERRADRLSAELRSRKVHAEVLKYCNPELLQKNYFMRY